MDRREKEKQAKINTTDEKIWVTQLMQRYGKQELTTMFVCATCHRIKHHGDLNE